MSAGFLIWIAFSCFFSSFVYADQLMDFTNEKDKLTEEEKKIFKMDLHQLMQVDVVVISVSKRPQKLHDTASAIYVVTSEDIRRTGAVNIMEALRIVPGVQVSKINQNRYAVSIRGFNRRLGSDKLLVVIDGRSVYSPSAAGVFWIGQDTLLEDIDRIEVIRGPGAALWGSNAVAGVINIITKSSHKTQGVLISGGAGTEERGFGSFRYGGKIREGLDYRVYGKYRDRDEGKRSDGSDAFDDKQQVQGGFRGDWKINSNDHLTMQGDYYTLDAELDFNSRFVSLSAGNAPFTGVTTQKGANFLMRWNHKIDPSSSLKLQAYYDRLERKASGVPFNNLVEQGDIEFQHDFLYGARHNISWGLNYRFTHFNFDTTNILQLPKRDTNLFGFFVHDAITLLPDTWNFTAGIKVEHNEFSGFEFQPSFRTTWTPSEKHTLWAAFSRAVRIPTLTEAEAVVNRVLISRGSTFPALVREENKGELDAEVLLAYETGYRFQYQANLHLDLTGYYFDYDKLIELTTGSDFFEATPGPAHIVIPLDTDNALEGEVFGFEISAQWQPIQHWTLSGSYTLTKVNLRKSLSNVVVPGPFNNEGDLNAEGEPEHLFNVRSYLNLPYDLEFDTLLYFVSENTARNIPSYTRLDLRLGWRPTRNLEFSLFGQNILDPNHPELNELLEASSETQRSFYFKAIFTF